MLAWLIQYGEPLPISGYTDRLQRTGILGKTLVERGHQVLWWTSTFDQYQKQHLYQQDTVCRPLPGLEIRLLHTSGYRRHVSLARLRDHRQLGRKFAQDCLKVPRPDIIYCSLPTLELSWAAVQYGKRFSVPVVLDVRDWWPDIFLDMFPPFLRPFARIGLHPMFQTARQACAGATAIIGITPEFVDWGLAKAGRSATCLDRAFPFGYSIKPPPEADLAKARDLWRRCGIGTADWQFVVCFFGTIGKSFDLTAVVEAARELQQQKEKILFVLCGKGDRLQNLKARAEGLQNILFPGWVGAAEIHTLMRLCGAGLDPLPDRGDFLASINNKAIEYFSAGLPVISSPASGALFNLLRHHQCGRSYAAGDAGGLAAVVKEMAHNPGLLQAMAANAKALFDSTFVAEKVYGEMADLLEGLVSHVEPQAP